MPVSRVSDVKDEHACDRLIFVESPYGDIFISKSEDTAHLGTSNILEMRGLPEKKSMVPVIGYEVHHLDANYVEKCYLKVYAVSKNQASVSVYGTTAKVDELNNCWRNFPLIGENLGQEILKDQEFLLYDVTEFAKKELQEGILTFYLESDSKKVVDIASRESGLSPELIFEVCAVAPGHISAVNDIGSDVKASMKILPCDHDGKLTVQLSGVPAGGFADLMIMNDNGDILKRVPLAIREGMILYHSIDFGDLLTGHYWALFRKGRVMIRKEFLIKPSQRADRLLEVQFIADSQEVTSKNR